MSPTCSKQAIELRDLLLDIINYRCCVVVTGPILIINLLLLFRSHCFELVIFRYCLLFSLSTHLTSLYHNTISNIYTLPLRTYLLQQTTLYIPHSLLYRLPVITVISTSKYTFLTINYYTRITFYRLFPYILPLS